MSYTHPVTPDHPLCGTWSAPVMEGQPAESIRTQYTISVVDERFKITGIDLVDGEEFLIFDVSYNGDYLMFTSVMPSTNTQARTWMRVIDQEKIECRWTISETEVWHRKPPQLRLVK